MKQLRVVPIVEGHGEVAAIRTLLQRIWTELLGGDYIEVVRPIRVPRGKILQKTELRRYVEIAGLKLESTLLNMPGMVLILLDADDRAPCVLGPQLCDLAAEGPTDLDIACVVANIEFETWFVASARSVPDMLALAADESAPTDPESNRLGKAWVERRFRGGKYIEPVDQPRITARMDLNMCRSACPSFDKLCRELTKRLQPIEAPGRQQ